MENDKASNHPKGHFDACNTYIATHPRFLLITSASANLASPCPLHYRENHYLLLVHQSWVYQNFFALSKDCFKKQHIRDLEFLLTSNVSDKRLPGVGGDSHFLGPGSNSFLHVAKKPSAVIDLLMVILWKG